MHTDFVQILNPERKISLHFEININNKRNSHIVRNDCKRRLQWRDNERHPRHCGRVSNNCINTKASVFLRQKLHKNRQTLEDNIKINLTGRKWNGMDYTDIAQDTDKCQGLVKCVLKYLIKPNACKLSMEWETCIWSRRTPLHVLCR